MGILILKKRYEPSKYISVLMITLGIIACTIISGTDVVRNIFYCVYVDIINIIFLEKYSKS